MKLIRTYWSLFTLAGLIIALDQWTKWLVRENIVFAQQWMPAGWEWLAPYARIVHWQNTGAAFGMFQNYGWMFSGLAFVVAGLIIYYYPKVEPQDWWMRLAMGMQMAGALGNVIDRILFQGKVTDFLSVGTFPVFNVADASISVGVAILIVGMWFKERNEQKAKTAEPAPEQETTVGNDI